MDFLSKLLGGVNTSSLLDIMKVGGGLWSMYNQNSLMNKQMDMMQKSWDLKNQEYEDQKETRNRMRQLRF